MKVSEFIKLKHQTPVYEVTAMCLEADEMKAVLIKQRLEDCLASHGFKRCRCPIPHDPHSGCMATTQIERIHIHYVGKSEHPQEDK